MRRLRAVPSTPMASATPARSFPRPASASSRTRKRAATTAFPSANDSGSEQLAELAGDLLGSGRRDREHAPIERGRDSRWIVTVTIRPDADGLTMLASIADDPRTASGWARWCGGGGNRLDVGNRAVASDDVLILSTRTASPASTRVRAVARGCAACAAGTTARGVARPR